MFFGHNCFFYLIKSKLKKIVRVTWTIYNNFGYIFFPLQQISFFGHSAEDSIYFKSLFPIYELKDWSELLFFFHLFYFSIQFKLGSGPSTLKPKNLDN